MWRNMWRKYFDFNFHYKHKNPTVHHLNSSFCLWLNSDQFNLLVNSSSDSLHSNWTQTKSRSPEQFWFVSTVSSGSVYINPQFTVTCEDILSLHADDVRLSLSLLSCPLLICLLVPEVIVLVRAAVNHLCTVNHLCSVSSVFTLTSGSLRGWVQSQSTVHMSSLEGAKPVNSPET